jgi:hypothetical protein
MESAALTQGRSWWKVVGPTPAYRVENLEGLVASALSNGLAEMGATLEGAEYASLFNDSLLLAWELTGLDAAGELRFVHLVEAVGWGRDGELVPFALGPFTREEAAGHAAAALRARPNVLTVTVKRQRPKGAYDPDRGLAGSIGTVEPGGLESRGLGGPLTAMGGVLSWCRRGERRRRRPRCRRRACDRSRRWRAT